MRMAPLTDVDRQTDQTAPEDPHTRERGPNRCGALGCAAGWAASHVIASRLSGMAPPTPPPCSGPT